MTTESCAYRLFSKIPEKTSQSPVELLLPERSKSSREKTPLGQCYLKCGISSSQGMIQLVDHPIYFLQHLTILENVIGVKEVWFIIIFKHCTRKAALIVTATNSALRNSTLVSSLHWLLGILVNINTTLHI